jgi:nucleotide-binding universal stress UspA family protein
LEINRRDEPLLDAATRTAVKSPLKIERILVPVDFSECSKKALAYALPLAREHGAAVALLYSVPPSYAVGEYGGMDYVQLQMDMSGAGNRELARLAGEVAEKKVAITTHLRIGVAATEIIEAARELPADLIVISTHGRTGLKHVLLGSVAEQVVQRAPCPVLVVRERERELLTD